MDFQRKFKIFPDLTVHLAISQKFPKDLAQIMQISFFISVFEEIPLIFEDFKLKSPFFEKFSLILKSTIFEEFDDFLVLASLSLDIVEPAVEKFVESVGDVEFYHLSLILRFPR